MRERKSIPILGIDERPNKRQSIPGLATTIQGVRPEGLEQEPYWSPIASVDELKNGSTTAFNHAKEDQIVRIFWHIRGRVGKFGNAGGSLKRLIILFDDGTVEIVDPDFGGGFATIETFAVTSSDSGDWDMSFTQLYDTGYASITKGGIPQVDLLIEDDLMLENEFPQLPVVKMVLSASDKGYTQEQIDAGTYVGFNTGYYFIRYAFRLKNGALVKHSAPEFIYTSVIPYDYTGDSSADTYFTSVFNFYLEGYGQTATPSNFDYWKDKISGVSVLISEPLYEGDIPTNDTKKKYLESASWYQFADFDFIDPSDGDLDQANVRIDIKDEDVTTLPTADVDDNTHHKKAHGVLETYNSRVIQGYERTDFALPTLNYKEGIYNLGLYIMADPMEPNNFLVFVYGDQAIFGTGATISAQTGCTVTQEVISAGIPAFYAVDPSGGTYSFTLTFDGLQSLGFLINLNQADFVTYLNKIVPLSEFTLGTSPTTSKLLVEAVIETDYGQYIRRISDVNVLTPFLASGFWYPEGSVIWYPDLRAKEINLYVDQTGTDDYELIKSVKLRPADKANFAFNILDSLELPTGGSHTNEPSAISVNDVCEKEPGKVRVSDVNNFLSYESDLVYNVGRGVDPVTGFAVNALQVSEGQYGQYPLYVFKKNEIWALEQSQSADVVFARITPIDVTLGADSNQKIITAGRAIVFAHSSGVYLLEGASPQRISEPVQSIHGSITALGYVRRDNDQELLVALNANTYRFSFRYGAWYRSVETVDHFFTDSDKLYARYSDDRVVDYQSELASEVNVSLILDSVHFGSPDILKRFYFFYVRGEVDDVLANKFALTAIFGTKNFSSVTNNIGSKRLRIKWKSEEFVKLTIGATMLPGTHQLHKIDTEYSVRYPRTLSS